MKLRIVIALFFANITLVAQNKKAEVALNNQAVALMDDGKYKEALAYLDKITASDTANFVYHYNRAVTLFNLKNYHAAIAEYKLLHGLLPEQSEYIFQIGNSYEHLDSIKLAISFYTDAIRMDPDHFIYFFKRGTLLLKQNRLHEAEADFSAAIELNPKHHNSFHNRGITRYKLGEKNKACEDWCHAVILGNAYSRSHFDPNCRSFNQCEPVK